MTALPEISTGQITPRCALIHITTTAYMGKRSEIKTDYRLRRTAMNQSTDRIALICGRIMQAAVEVNAAGRHQASAEFRGAGRIVDVTGYRTTNGAVDDESRIHLRVQLNNPYAEYLLKQALNTLEAMR